MEQLSRETKSQMVKVPGVLFSIIAEDIKMAKDMIN